MSVPAGPDEPLFESAAMALRLARAHCRAVPGLKDDCGWYHGFWQIVRALGAGKTSGGHAPFLIDVLRRHAAEGAFRRVLVSGTADYSMPALVYWAYAQERAPLELTVIDWCETPLALSRWYAQRVGQPVRTIRGDILACRLPAHFDLVLTNSFLGYFRPDARPALYAVWASLLRPGGKALLTNRVRAGADESPVGFRPDEADRFCEEIAARAGPQLAALGLDAGTVAAGARSYADRFRVYSVRSHAEVHEQLRRAGFGTLELDLAQSSAAKAAVSGPSTVEQATYARIVATRD